MQLICVELIAFDLSSSLLLLIECLFRWGSLSGTHLLIFVNVTRFYCRCEHMLTSASGTRCQATWVNTDPHFWWHTQSHMS